MLTFMQYTMYFYVCRQDSYYTGFQGLRPGIAIVGCMLGCMAHGLMHGWWWGDHSRSYLITLRVHKKQVVCA